MRVLLSCLQSPNNYEISGYHHWRAYFLQGLAEAGHEVVEIPNIDWAAALVCHDTEEIQGWRARTWDAVMRYLAKEHRQKPVDLFLAYLYPFQIEPGVIEEIQRAGVPCVNFFCDNVREFYKFPVAYKPFALHWVPEFEALPMYRAAGVPHLHAPMPCWVPKDCRSVPVAETEPPTFIGSPDILRRDLLGRALRSGGEFFVRGRGWEISGGDVSESGLARSWASVVQNQKALVRDRGMSSLFRKIDNHFRPLTPPPIPQSRIAGALTPGEYVRCTRESTVTIGVNRVPTLKRSIRRPLTYSRLRDIEAPMMGACYLTEWTSGLQCMYDLGNEIETYRTPDELCGMIAELRKDAPRRSAMRLAAQRRALADHSIPRTLELISARLGLSGN
jgi:hypothetical protein